MIRVLQAQSTTEVLDAIFEEHKIKISDQPFTENSVKLSALLVCAVGFVDRSLLGNVGRRTKKHTDAFGTS